MIKREFPLKKFKRMEDYLHISQCFEQIITESQKQSEGVNIFLDKLIRGEFQENELNDKLFLNDPKGLMIKADLLKHGEKNDGENAKLLYEALQLESIDEANDPRLWTYLSLVVFPNYISTRYPTRTPGVISNRMFHNGKTLANNKNALSRLWWLVHQTIDENNKNDPYYYTDLLFKGTNSQFIQDLIERKNIFKNKLLLQAFIEFREEECPEANSIRHNITRILTPLWLNHIRNFNTNCFSKNELKEIIKDFYNNTSYLREIPKKKRNLFFNRKV